MKRFAVCLAVIVGVAFAAPVFAGPGLSGPHWSIHLIGKPHNVQPGNGWDSNGRSIMVPLKNVNSRDELVCPTDTDAVFVDDEVPTFQSEEPAGAKIYWVSGDHFEILDRDATDSNGARIMIPTVEDPETGDQVIAVNVWVRVHGKPNTCMNIDGWAFDAGQALYFWAGQIQLARKTGRATWINVNKIFDVWWCDVDPETDACVAGTEVELSVFSDVFESYFWAVQNDGTRNVEIRLYPVTNGG
jgi:hypothetical protein